MGCRISSIYSNNRVLLRQPAHFYYNHAVYTIVVLNSIDMLTMVRLNYATEEAGGGAQSRGQVAGKGVMKAAEVARASDRCTNVT